MEYELTIEKFLKTSVHLRKSIGKPKNFFYNSIEDFVLQNGNRFYVKAHKLPIGKLKQCFKNSFETWIDNKGKYVYVEGFAYKRGLIPVHHAWLVDKYDGRAVDVTWKELDTQYFGVVFSESEFLITTILNKKTYGILDNWEGGHPLLKKKWTIQTISAMI